MESQLRTPGKPRKPSRLLADDDAPVGLFGATVDPRPQYQRAVPAPDRPVYMTCLLLARQSPAAFAPLVTNVSRLGRHRLPQTARRSRPALYGV